MVALWNAGDIAKVGFTLEDYKDLDDTNRNTKRMDNMREQKKAGRPITGFKPKLVKFYVDYEYTGIIVDAVDREEAISVAYHKLIDIPHPEYCVKYADKPKSVTQLGERALC